MNKARVDRGEYSRVTSVALAFAARSNGELPGRIAAVVLEACGDHDAAVQAAEPGTFISLGASIHSYRNFSLEWKPLWSLLDLTGGPGNHPRIVAQRAAREAAVARDLRVGFLRLLSFNAVGRRSRDAADGLHPSQDATRYTARAGWILL